MQKTGKIAVKGQERLGEPWGVFLISASTGSLEQPEVQEKLCLHWPNLECLQIEGHEYLAKSCSPCGDIKLINLQSGEVIPAFCMEKVGGMAGGENNILYVSQKDTNQIFELDCSKVKFRKLRTMLIGVRDEFCRSLSYIPSPYRMLVARGAPTHTPPLREAINRKAIKAIQAISCDSGNAVWTLEGKINGKEIWPSDMLFLPSHDVILVADSRQSGILVLTVDGGIHIQTIPLPDHVQDVSYLLLHAGQVLMKHGDINKHNDDKISYFSIIS